jgi:sulfur carrier protein ThiS
MGKVKVITVGLLKAHVPEETTVAAGQTVAQAVEMLGLHTGEGIVPLVNGRLAFWDTLLRDGDRLELVQSVSGG